MKHLEALRIVYDLASQNALDLDHQDADLREEAKRQDDALDRVYDLLQTGTLDNLMRAFLTFAPDGEMAEDSDGQIVFYTGLRQASNQNVVPYEESPFCINCGSTNLKDGAKCKDCGTWQPGNEL